MALDEADVELIRASWIPARKNSFDAGVLLFKGLFTKFPDYLKLFNQFENLDVERLHENKRLMKHAVKVIETVTFVVDSIGDPAKSEQLNGALVALVQGHLKRKIGLIEFRNLGIVLIDFICDLNNRRTKPARQQAAPAGTLMRGINSSASSSQDSETMTSTLDKIRASSSPSSSEDESLLARTSTNSLEYAPAGQRQTHCIDSDKLAGRGVECGSKHPRDDEDEGDQEREEERIGHQGQLDTSLLVASWTKLYGLILNLVESEEGGNQQAERLK